MHQLLHCQKCLCHVEPAEKAVCAVAAGMLSVFVGGHDASGSPPAIVGPNGVRPGASAAGTYTITQRATGILPVPSHGQDGHATIPRGCSAALRYPPRGAAISRCKEKKGTAWAVPFKLLAMVMVTPGTVEKPGLQAALFKSCGPSRTGRGHFCRASRRALCPHGQRGNPRLTLVSEGNPLRRLLVGS